MLLIVKIQANLARNKTNKMVDKIQLYKYFCRKVEGHVTCQDRIYILVHTLIDADYIYIYIYIYICEKMVK